MKPFNINNFISRPLFRLPIFIFSLLFAACVKLDTDLKKELDLNTISFPPKLVVFATLDGEKGCFNIRIAEGRSLADYIEPRPYYEIEVIREGEIRLFEDDKLIMSESGTLDISYNLGGTYILEEVVNGVYGKMTLGSHNHFYYQFEKSGISTRAGSVYRLEVEIEGYETATSTITMPAAPVVAATIDTTVMVIKNYSQSFNAYFDSIVSWREMGRHYINLPDDSYDVGFWPVSVQLTDPDPNARNYFAVEMNYGVGVSDISILQDNPDLEVLRGGLVGTNYADFYVFGTFLMSDRTFSGKTAPLTFYSIAENTSNPDIDNPSFTENPEYEKVVLQRTTSLRILQLHESTFRYYRGQALQQSKVGFFTEPVTLTGNIKNGYGHFAAFNATTIPLLEYEYQEWQREGEQ